MRRRGSGRWHLPARARTAALDLTGSVEDPDTVVELLQDVAEILADAAGSVIPTKDLVARLTALDDRPWATWRRDDKPMTGRGLARFLGPLGIHPVKLSAQRRSAAGSRRSLPPLRAESSKREALPGSIRRFHK